MLVALACALAAVATSLLACFASQDGRFSPSALVKLSRAEPMAAVARASDPSFAFVNPVEHYDGVYYYVMARDPLLHGPSPRRAWPSTTSTRTSISTCIRRSPG